MSVLQVMKPTDTTVEISQQEWELLADIWEASEFFGMLLVFINDEDEWQDLRRQDKELFDKLLALCKAEGDRIFITLPLEEAK